MRLLILLMIIVLLMGCVGQQGNPYLPHPLVEVSTFTTGDRITAAYIRHSSGCVLIRLADGNLEGDISGDSMRLVLPVALPARLGFTSVGYEGFDQSLDLFQDGRIVLVPFPEHNGIAVGVFANLLSGTRYLFVPSIKSSESVAKLRQIRNELRGVNVIVPDDTWTYERVARFPEFQK